MRKSRNLFQLSLMAIIGLCSSAAAFAQLTVSATSNLGSVVVNTTGPTHTISVKNAGASAITFSSIAVTPGGPYGLVTAASSPCGASLAANATCNVGIHLSPTTLGAQPAGTLTITSSAPGSPNTVALSGTGVEPTVASPATLAFGNVVINTSSPARTVTVYNYLLTSVSISSVSVTPASPYATAGGTCGSSIAAGANCTILVKVTPTALGAVAPASLTVATSATNSPLIVPLTATSVAASTVSPTSVSFGNVVDGEPSLAKTVTLYNNQSTAVTISSITPSTGIVVNSGAPTACGSSLAAGANCTISLTWTPTALGALTGGSLNIATNAANGPITVPLTGTGIVPTSVSPASFNFGNVVVNTTSSLKTFTLTNNQASSLTVSSLAVTPGSPYSINPSSTCLTPTVAAGGTCSVVLSVSPLTVGAQPAASLTITTNASNSPNTVPLSATGISAVSLSVNSVNFGNEVLGTISAAKQIKLTNNQSSALTFTGSVFNGPFVLDTSAATTCPNSGGALSGVLAAGASCYVGVDFAPTALGATSGGQITIIDSAANSPQVAYLSGDGVIAVGLSPSSLGFGNVVIETTSATKDVTLTNNQSSALSLTSIGVPAPYAIVAPVSGTACVAGGSVAAGAKCTFGVAYSPTALGAAPAVVTITDSAASSPQTVPLTGTGIVPVTLPSALAFGNVVIGEMAEKNVTLKNNQVTALSISSIAGFTGGYSLDTTQTTCSTTTTLAPGLSCVIGVDLTAPSLGLQPAASFMVTDSASTSPQPVTLTATALQPVVLSRTSVSFPTTFVGVESAGQSVVLTNEQAGALTITSANVTGADPGDFVVGSTCPTVPNSLPGGHTCSINLYFKPTASGARTATLTIVDGVSNSPQTVALSGNGNAPVVISPDTTQSFTAPVGTTSAYKTFTIYNEQLNTPLHIYGFRLSGPFIQSATTCPMSPAALGGTGALASCTLSVEFDPTIGGVSDGQLQVEDDAGTSPQVVNLTGTGTNPLTIAPPSLSFSAQTIGTVSVAKVVTLTNHESQPETFSVTAVGTVAGGTADYGSTNSCATGVIGANSTCLLNVNFSPTLITAGTAAPTTRTGTLTVTDSAPGGSPLVASLTGSATLTPPPAAVSVVSPGAGQTGTVVPVVITGNGWTHFSNASMITFVETNSPTTPCNIAVSGISATSANSLNATLTLSGNTFGACNISVKSPLMPSGTETATLLLAFNLAEAPGQAIASISPTFGTQGQTLNVAITAVDTNFQQGVTIANFGDGVQMNSLTITSATTATANITISNTTPVGFRTLTMQTNGEFAISGLNAQGNPIFQIGANNAALVSVSPNVEPQGFDGTVTLTATGSHFLQNATTVTIGGATVGDVNVMSPTVAVAQILVAANAPIGVGNVTVATGGEIFGLNNAFTVTGATPALVSVVPSSGVQGQTLDVIINGNAFTTFNVGTVMSEFTGEITVNSTTALSANQVDANITIHGDAVVGPITATLVYNGTTNFPFGFTVTPSSASIVSVTPSCIPQGGQLTLNIVGSNTNWIQGTTIAAFYPESVPYPSVDEVTINSATSAALAVAVPTNAPPGNYGFYIATGGQVVSSSMCVTANTPTVTMSPANGLLPTAPAVNSFTVNFTGQFTTWGPTTLPVIAGEGVTLSHFTVLSPVSASATLTIIGSTNGTPTATGPRLVTLTTGGQIVTTYFNVTQTPVGIINVTPDHAAPSTNGFNVEIVGLNTHFTAGVTQVLFGPQITVNSVTVNSDTDLIANISTDYLLSGVVTPSPSGWQTVFVNTGVEQVMTAFLVDYPALPSLVSVSPSSGAQGQTLSDVVITGSLTNWVQGQTDAILGAGISISNLTITSPTSATATIAISPTAPVGGNTVVMYTGSQIVSGSGFSVTPSAAYIQSVEPNFTCPTTSNFIAGFNCTAGQSPTGVPVVAQLQTVTLNIVGVGTHWLQGETTMNFGFGVVTDQLTVSSPTTAQAQITVLSLASVGFSTLTTSTDGEVVYLPQAIDIEEGSPILLAFSPGGGEQGTSTTLQLLGRFTHFNQATTNVAFNQDITVNSINVIDSENMTANITISPLAYVDYDYPCGHIATITTGNEQVSMAIPTPGTFCVAQGAEQINTVTPASGVQGSTETVTIVGSATDFINGETSVSFGDSGISFGTVTVNSPTSLTVPVAISTSASVGYHTATVTTLGEVATQQFAFTVNPGVATLNEAIPNQLEQGVQSQVVRLIGQYSHFSGLSTATFGAGITVNSYDFVSTTEVDANISIDPLSYTGGRLVTVTTPGILCSVLATTEQPCAPGTPGTSTGSEIVSAYVFSVIPGPAIISNVMPNTGNEGQEVVFNITGSATHWQQNFTQFYIVGGGSDLTINSVVINSATSATVDMSISPTANPGARSIYMVTNGESLTDSGAFVVTGGVPVITYLSPSSHQNNPSTGTQGLQVDIYGLYTNWAAGSSTPSFGPGITVESFQVDNATHIEAVIDIAANAQDGYRTVVVQTGQQGLTGNFLVTAPAPPPTPFIWYLSPGSALPGQTLTITFNGAYTDWQPGTGPACSQNGTTLTGFNANVTVNCFQVLSPTSAIANITIAGNASPSTSDLTLTTGATNMYPSGEVENAQFSVVIAQPVLSIVDPGSGLQGANMLTVDILGQYTTFDATTTFSFGPNITVNGPPTILGPTIATQSISINQLAPLGGVQVVATTPDAAPIAQVVGGAYFDVTPSLALISSITPNTAAQGTNVTVDVQGMNTHWNGSTTFSFGGGIVVSSVLVNSETDATVTLVIPPLAPEGPVGASAHTAGEDATITNGFVITAGTPYLLSSGPGSVPQQGSVVFTILSQATTWSNAAPPTVSYGPYITLTNVNVTGPTSMTVDGYVSPTAPVGYYNLSVTTGTQQLGINNAVYISPGPAVINSVTPSSGGQGVNLPAVQINGTNTHWASGGATLLSFPNVLINSFTVTSPTTIIANITVNTNAPAGQYNVTATTGGEVATGVNVFTVTQDEPELLAVVPNSGVQGLTSSPVTLTADFTNFVNGTTTANFGTGITVNSVNVTSTTQAMANITVSPTTTLGYRNVSVSTGAQVVSLANGYQVIQGPAEIQGPLNPATGGQGHTVNVIVTGSQTHFAQGVTTASFGGGIQVTSVTVNGLLSATVTINIPTGTPLGAYNVVLTTGGEVATILGGFTVTSGSPQISLVSPPTGTQGITLNVGLTGLFTNWVQGTSVATFGSGITVNSLTVNSATSATANITISPTATIGSYSPTVTTSGQVATEVGGFSVLAGVPTLLTASPGTIQAGTTGNIVINGTFTNFQQAFTTVNFGSGITVNFITVSSFTQLTANITAASNAAVGGRTIQVNTNSQDLQLNSAFMVTAGTPEITQINPNIGEDGQTLNVNLTGLYTNWVNGTTTISFGSGITVNSVTVNSFTSLVANITIGASTPTGPVDVMTATGGEMESVPGGFTVEPATIPSPTLLSISPGPNYNSGIVPINSSFTMVFSQPMNRSTLTTSSVEMWLVSNPGGWVSLPGAVTVDATGRVATFTPTSLLAVNSQYYLYLTSAIQDAAGTSFGNYGYVSFYTADSANTTPATVAAANPPANATNVGTNVTVELAFSTEMNQSTQSGLVVSAGGTPVAGSWSWNSNPYGQGPGWGPGTLLYFVPTAPYAANTVFTVSYGAPLADTAGNGLTPGSFTFKTGAGADTAQNYTSATFVNYETNLGTNFAPELVYSKPANPIDINSSTVLLYNGDSNKYIQGTVTVAANGLSSTFTPTYPLLPNTYYHLHQSCGDYDMDGNYLNCSDWYFTTGTSTDTTQPTVASISPANNATSVPLNAQVTAHFSAPINPETVSNAITVTPMGGSAIAGTATLASDLVTFTFVPTASLQPNTMYTVAVSGETDLAGNVGVPFSSSFTSAVSAAVINVSTGLNASGQRITTNNTNDANWTYVPVANLPGQGTEPLYAFSAGANATGPAAPLQTVGPGDTGWYSGWTANGPTSDWITINPNSTTNNTLGVYSTTFNIPGPTVPTNLCLAGNVGADDNGELAVNGNAITGNFGYGFGTINAAIPAADLVVGSNTLSLGWGTTDNSYEAFRLTGTIETCGASFVGALSVTSSTPSNGATGVATNTTITLNFNNALDPATVNSSTLAVLVANNGTYQLAGSYQVNGNQVIFTPDSPLPVNDLIYVYAVYGPRDLAGDSAGGNYTELFSFTTGGTATPPANPFQVIAFTPAANATNVGLRAPVSATFNRSVNPYSINPNVATADFGLFAGDSQTPTCGGGSYTKSQDNTTISFNCYPMPAGTVMTAALNSNLSDWTGDALQNYSSQFTTGAYDANTNGVVISTRPGNTASGIAVNEPITIYTSLPINAATANNGFEVAQNNVNVPGSIAVLDNGYTLEFTPSSPWTPGALIQWWTTSTLLDTTYNTPFNGAYGYFTVAASTASLAPAVQVASPPEYSNPVALNAIFDVQFNTALNPATVTGSTVYLYDATTTLNVAATLSQPEPNEIRLTPTSSLPVNHYIYVELTTGLQSATSVPLGANTSWWEYTGTTADSTVPTIVSAVPYAGSMGVGVNITPNFVISKPIDPVSVNPATFTVSNGGTPLAGTFYLNSSDTRVDFVPNAPLPANATLTMALNGVLDLVGHSISYSSSFMTGPGPDFTQPTVIWSSVNSNESIPTNSMIEVRFSESMDLTTFAAGEPGACGNFYIQDELSGDGIGCIATTLTWSADQSTAYLTPVSPLAAGRQYYFNVSGGTDLAGNGMASDGFYFYAEFSGSSSAPTVVAFNPHSGLTTPPAGTNAVIEAEFSAPIDPTSISNVTLTQGGTVIPTTPVMSAGNTVLQLVPSAQLSPGMTYSMNIIGVVDPAGNHVTTISNSFTTGLTYDINPPAVVFSDPAYNSTVGTNVNPKFLFNKPLNPLTVNSGTFRIYLTDTNQLLPATVALSSSGEEVTITPLVALLPNTKYQFSGGWNGGPQDQDGNYVNLPWYYFWTNGGSVSSGPTVTVSPANLATGVPTNAQILATVSAPIDPTTWSQSSVQLLNGSTPVAGTGTLPNAQTLIFKPTSPLTAMTTYTVNVGGFTDASGNAVVPSSTTFTTGTVAATGGLTTQSFSITSGQNITSNMLPVTVTFTQTLDPLTVSTSTFLVTNSQNTLWGLAGNYTVNGNAITFTPTSPYPPNATIWIYVTSGLMDLAGDAYGGSTWPYDFTTNGSTPDSTALTVVSVSPAAGATNVRPDMPVSVTFNKGINPYSVYNNGNNALLFAGQGLQDRGSITMSADNRTLTFNSGVLYTGTQYTIQLPAGGISDPSGNTLANTFSSTFTTGTNPATGNGGVQSPAPGNGATGVPTDTYLTLYLNRQVNASTLPGNVIVTVNGQVDGGNVVATADNYEVQFQPTNPFPNGAAVQWWFSALGTVLDVNGDSMNGDSGYFYTAAAVNAATAAPVNVNNSPGSGTTNIPTNSDIYLEFSQPLNGATLTTANVYLYDNTTNTYPTVTISQPEPTVIELQPGSPLIATHAYYACANGNVKGTNGVANTTGCWDTNFNAGTASDTTPGTVIVGPPNGSTGVGTNAYVRLVFSKPFNRAMFNQGATPNAQVTVGGNPVAGLWSFVYNSGTNDAIGADFSPINPLPPSTVVSVSVSGVLDYAGNTFGAVSTSFTTAALPDYSTPTATLDFPSTTYNIGTNASFTCLYSEPMDPSSINQSNTHVWSQVTNAFIPVTYTWASDLMSVTMTPVTALYADAYYYYQCDGGIDLTGNGLNNNYSYFYTGNGQVNVGPTLVYANPPSGDSTVPLNSIGGPWNNTSLMLLFNEPIATQSLSTITFTPQGGSAEPIAVYAEDGDYIADVQLPWALQPNMTYTFNFAGVTDFNGNPAQGTTTSSFSTGSSFDWTSPVATAATPANGTTTSGVNPVISLTFSELMNPALFDSNHVYLRTHNTQTTVPTTLALSTVGGVTVVTLTPTSPLAESTIYDLVYATPGWYLYDVAGNYDSQTGVESTFTTGTTAAVNGACGTSNGLSFSSAPTANLCSAGIASAVTNVAGAWSWSCNGEYTGTNASCSATVTGTPACFAQPSSLVSLWPGNNNPNDVGPGANNGTLENGVTYGLGETGDAFSLDGSNQYVFIAQPVPTNLQIQGAISMSAWVYMTALPTNLGSGAFATIVGSQDGGSSGIGLYIDNNGGSTDVPPGGVDFNIGTGSGYYSVYTTTQVPLNQWTLVTVTASANNPSLVYLNGVAQPTIAPNQPLSDWTTSTTVPYNASGQWFAIGQSSAANYPFTGLLNDVAVFNAALTPTQIQNIYNAGSGGICP